MAPGRGSARRRRRPGPRVFLLILLAGAGAPAPASAWPAILDAAGAVSLCDSRPVQLPSGLWSCRSLGGTPEGRLVEVTRPGVPPGARPGGPPYGPPGRWGRWGPPPREPSGYDALDPWLGGGGVPDR